MVPKLLNKIIIKMNLKMFVAHLKSYPRFLKHICFDMQRVKKNREPRWDEDFQFPLDEPPINDKLHVEVISTTSRIGLNMHPKV